MEQENINMQDRNLEEIDTVSKALSSIYTGVFFIDLKKDTYRTVSAPETIIAMLKGMTSAQEAINFAIRKVVSEDKVQDVITFVNLLTLPKRMSSKRFLNIEYRGKILGWVRGSFIEAKRDERGELTQVLYTYQVIDEAKRKELDTMIHLEADKVSLTSENKELQQARDAVYTILKSGSFICIYGEIFLYHNKRK